MWTWTAICADTKLCVSFLVGDRTGACANAFMQDVARRVNHRVQLTTDGNNVYVNAVEEAFGSSWTTRC